MIKDQRIVSINVKLNVKIVPNPIKFKFLILLILLLNIVKIVPSLVGLVLIVINVQHVVLIIKKEFKMEAPVYLTVVIMKKLILQLENLNFLPINATYKSVKLVLTLQILV